MRGELKGSVHPNYTFVVVILVPVVLLSLLNKSADEQQLSLVSDSGCELMNKLTKTHGSAVSGCAHDE